MDINQAVELCAEGNQGAWTMIINNYSKLVYNIAIGFTHNSDDAADLVQDIFIKIFNNLQKFDKTSNFKSWLIRIAKNHCIDFWRKNKKNKNRVVLEDNIADNSMGPDENNLKSFNLKLLRESIKLLEPDLKTAIIMRDVQGISYSEMADILGIPVGTVKSRINRARIKLAKKIRNGGYNGLQ